MPTIQERKADHIRINLEKDVKASTNPWDAIRLQHNALPEVDRSKVDLTATLLGRTLKAPIIISGMTGGAPEAQKINENLAIAAETLGLGMGVGSQRAALVQKDLVPTYSVIRNHQIPLRLANLGIPQLVKWGPEETLRNARACVEMIDAHALAIHLNYLQESVQPEGDTNARGSFKAIEALAKVFRIPIMVKETGAGISEEVARALARTGIKAIDVGGWGGTSFSAVEVYRAAAANDQLHVRMGETFWDWGIPTPESVRQVVGAVNDKIQVVATGGIRNGLDAARALALGADAVAVAGAVLPKAAKSAEATIEELRFMIEELRTAFFLTGAQNLDQFHQTARVLG
ncbi:MAG TPA: type 2 isopentenyl-diphosphate Delta-isomerase [Candidatus Thermoplasmatota archaeon]|nr:type 2 isopentenyl-diphosphate Delta-isomerase [Candidatus Thermoplasmatota archaeon]